MYTRNFVYNGEIMIKLGHHCPSVEEYINKWLYSNTGISYKDLLHELYQHVSAHMLIIKCQVQKGKYCVIQFK